MHSAKLFKDKNALVLVDDKDCFLVDEVAKQYGYAPGHLLINKILETIEEQEIEADERLVSTYVLEGLDLLLHEPENSKEFLSKLEIALTLLYEQLFRKGVERINYESEPDTDWGKNDYFGYDGYLIEQNIFESHSGGLLWEDRVS